MELEVSTMVIQFIEKSRRWESKKPPLVDMVAMAVLRVLAHLGWVWTETLETEKDLRVRAISWWLVVVACDAHVTMSGGLWRFAGERRWESYMFEEKKREREREVWLNETSPRKQENVVIIFHKSNSIFWVMSYRYWEQKLNQTISVGVEFMKFEWWVMKLSNEWWKHNKPNLA